MQYDFVMDFQSYQSDYHEYSDVTIHTRGSIENQLL